MKPFSWASSCRWDCASTIPENKESMCCRYFMCGSIFLLERHLKSRESIWNPEKIERRLYWLMITSAVYYGSKASWRGWGRMIALLVEVSGAEQVLPTAFERTGRWSEAANFTGLRSGFTQTAHRFVLVWYIVCRGDFYLGSMKNSPEE